MKWDQQQPCTTCPYLRRSPLAIWDEAEFLNLKRQDADPIRGRTFGCHSFRKLPQAEHRVCVGWLLDQARRHMPSMRLRMELLANAEAMAAFARLSADGLEMYDSIHQMHLANYPPRRR